MTVKISDLPGKIKQRFPFLATTNPDKPWGFDKQTWKTHLRELQREGWFLFHKI